MGQDASIIVIGGLNTDIIALGAKKLLSSGELTYASSLKIGPGGKSRNIAQMMGVLSRPQSVAMIGKTSQDPYGLWRLPIESLEKAGVDTRYITKTTFEESGQFPGIALIPVDENGHNQIYVISGINDTFSPDDIEKAHELFETVAKNKGLLLLTLELPYETGLFAVRKATEMGMKVLFDPGGIDPEKDYSELLSQHIFFIKPNEHEAKILTGVEVADAESAQKAANVLLSKNIRYVCITMGEKGAYLFSKSVSKHLAIPEVSEANVKDATGCGDQTMAAFAVALQQGKSIEDAVKMGIVAGTLEFHKAGIVPITSEEIAKYL